MKIKTMSAVVYALILSIGITGCQKDISTLDSEINIADTKDVFHENEHIEDSVCDECILEEEEDSAESDSSKETDTVEKDTNASTSNNKVSSTQVLQNNTSSSNQTQTSNSQANSSQASSSQTSSSQTNNSQSSSSQTSSSQTSSSQGSQTSSNSSSSTQTTNEIDYRDRIRIDGNVSTDRLNLLNEELNKIPKNLINKFFAVGGTIVLTSYDIGSHYFPDKGFGQLMELHDGGNQVLYIDHRKEAIEQGTAHGFGHVLDSLTGWSFNSQTFLDIFEKEKNTFKTYDGRDYFKNNEREFFAEIFHNYLKSPSTVKSTAPEGYAYVINKLNSL